MFSVKGFSRKKQNKIGNLRSGNPLMHANIREELLGMENHEYHELTRIDLNRNKECECLKGLY